MADRVRAMIGGAVLGVLAATLAAGPASGGEGQPKAVPGGIPLRCDADLHRQPSAVRAEIGPFPGLGGAGSVSNDIQHNTVALNTVYGLMLTGSMNNSIDHNNIVGNEVAK